MDNSTFAPLIQTIVSLPAIIDNLLLLLSDKEKVVIKKRFSLSGAKKHTLDEIGKEFSVTRERIRQVEKNALSKMRRNVFNTALRSIHDFSLSSVRKHGGLVKEEVLFNEVESFLTPNITIDRNSMHLAFSLHDQLQCIGNTINFYPYIRENKISDYSLKYFSDHLINQLNKYGDCKTLDRIHNDLKNVFEEVNFDLPKVKSLIDIDKRITLLENDLVGLMEWRHIHPRTLRDKILYVLRKDKRPLHFLEISEKISTANFDRRNVNVQAVHNELIRHTNFVLIGRGIYALAEWGYEKGTVSKVIENILKEEKELSQDKIIELVLKQRQVKEITIILALKNSENFERVGRKRYKLKSL